MSTYTRFCNSVILPAGDKLSGQKVLPYLDFFRNSQYWPADRIRETRDQLIREVVRTAYDEVPFYRELYGDHGVGPDHIQTAEDLPKLPQVSKAMLADAGEKAVRPVADRTLIYSTSGSTGNPFKLKVDTDTVSRARALMLLRTEYAGYRTGDRTVQTGTAPERGFVKRLKDLLLKVDYVSAFDLSPELIDRKLALMQENRTRFLTGYAQSLDLFAQRALETGVQPKLTAAVSWGALLLPSYREAVKRAFDCPTYDSYGVGEGMQVASQCGHDEETFHLFALAVHCEACNGGVPVPTGETGELLLTRLNAGPTPLIRYQIGDLGALTDRWDCPCGRHLPVMKGVVGRTSDIIRTPGGKRLVIHFFTRIFSSMTEVQRFQIRQSRLDEITILIVPASRFGEETETHIRSELESRGDPQLKVRFEIVDDIPVGNNSKRRYIISELD